MAFDVKHNSRAITDRPDRAATRSYFYGTGLTKEDIPKPLVGIANTSSGTLSCNFNLRSPGARNVRCIDAALTPRLRSRGESSMIAA